MVINVFSPASAKNFEEYAKFMLVEERRKGASRYFFVADDLIAELGLLCVDDSDDLTESYGPTCSLARS